MPEVNWDDVEDNEGGGDFTPLADGEYTCMVAKVEDGTTKKGDVMWTLELRVCEGPNMGRKVFDRLFFSEKALPRVKLVYSRFGLKTDGSAMLIPSDLEGRKAIVTVYADSYSDKDGKEKPTNTIPFDGYAEIDPTDKQTNDDSEGLPF